ncbi:MAG: hypothetical protein AB7V16_03470 [Vulcanibacillus sp.]
MSLDNLYNIQIQHLAVGKDNFFLITGGVAHIGASATAYWNGEELITYLVELPHHKEGALAKELVELAAKSLNSSCTVVMGIHIDQASLDVINYIVNYVRVEMVTTINKIKN